MPSKRACIAWDLCCPNIWKPNSWKLMTGSISKINPENHIEHVMTQSLSQHLVQFLEAGREQIHHKLKVAQRTLLCWDDDRLLAAAALGDDLGKRPVSVAAPVEQLQAWLPVPARLVVPARRGPRGQRRLDQGANGPRLRPARRRPLGPRARRSLARARKRRSQNAPPVGLSRRGGAADRTPRRSVARD